MPIDPSIALGVRPVQIENPLTQYAHISQLQGVQNQNRLADLLFAEKQREVEQTNALSELYKSALGANGQIDRAKLFSGAAAGGLGAKIPVLQKTFSDQDRATADLEKARWDSASKKLEIAGQAFGYVRNNPTLENAHQTLDFLGQNGIYTPEQVSQYKALVAADPSKIAGLAEQAFRAVLDAKDQLPKIETRNLGGTTDTISIDPVTQNVKKINSARNTQSPDNAATVAATIRGQDKPVWDSERGVFVSPTGGIITPTGGAGQGLPPKQSDVANLRKEFDALPEVKSYKQAFPSFAAVKDAASRQGPQSDINLIYGMAKLYDPNSVVREGEYATIANSQAIPERIKSIAQSLAGGGKLTPETKRQLLEEAQGRINTYEAEYNKARGSYGDIAGKGGIDTANVFPDAGSFKSVKVDGKTLTARQAPDGKFYVQQNGKYYEVR